MREKAISPLRQRMIEDMSSVRKSDDQSGSRYIHWQEFASRGQIADAAVILTSRSKQLSISARDINRQESVRAMRLKDYREAHRARVVECAIFATRNSLKSKAAQNMKSPFSNIRANISNLHWRSMPT